MDCMTQHPEAFVSQAKSEHFKEGHFLAISAQASIEYLGNFCNNFEENDWLHNEMINTIVVVRFIDQWSKMYTE